MNFRSIARVFATVLIVESLALVAFANSPAVEKRINTLIQAMTLEEKVGMLYGSGVGMENQGVARLGIPSIKMTDGPIGVRWEKATAFPSSISMGATFDPQLMHSLGVALGQETLAKGRDMLLGPCVNLSRAPLGGRNFESYGEDPILTSAFARAWVQGVQSQGVMASTKHFAGNEQEFERMSINVKIDERTLHELHLPAFLTAVRAGTWSVMSSYNRLNGAYTSESGWLLNDLLKKRWGFQGFVVSDWGANHSTVESANAGLDVEMPLGEFWAHGQLVTAVRNGQVAEKTVDDKVRRILRAIIMSGKMTRVDARRPSVDVINSPAHQALALKAAQDSLVLLKNNGVLPLSASQKIAIIGPHAKIARNNGGGSSRVVGYHDISPLEGLRNRTRGAKIEFAQGSSEIYQFTTLNGTTVTSLGTNGETVPGFRAEYFANMNLEGEPVLVRTDEDLNFDWMMEAPAPGVPAERFSVRWTGTYRSPKTGDVDFAVRTDDGSRVYIDDQLLINDWNNHAATTTRYPFHLEKGREYRVRIEYFENTGGAEARFGFTSVVDERAQILRDEAAELARNSDVAIIFVGSSEMQEGEGVDRPSMGLPSGQDALIEAVVAANPRTIVVLNSGGALLMPWKDKVAGIVQAWYAGQEGGNAIADALLGRTNFTGKLPVSFYKRDEDASSFGRFPGVNGQTAYTEGVFLGYRHLDSRGIEPLYPFGFGLSYTTFKMSRLQLRDGNASTRSPFAVFTVDVTNTGRRAGAEVVQAYVSPRNPRVVRPYQELKDFQKVWLRPGETQRVMLRLPKKSFAYYDAQAHQWRVDAGAFDVRVGNSSRNLPLVKTLRLQGRSQLIAE